MVLSTPYVPTKRCIQETLGRFNYFVMPGLGYQIPIVHTIRIRALRENTMKIHPHTVITKDNVEIMVDGIMWARSTIVDWQQAIIQLAMTNLRQEFGDLILDESLVARETIATNFQRILNTYTVQWEPDGQ